MKRKTKKKVLIISTITAVITFALLCGMWHGNAFVKAVLTLLFFASLLVAGVLAVTYDGGHDDDF